MTTETMIRPRDGFPKLGTRKAGPPGPRGGRSELLRTHQDASPERGKQGIGIQDEPEALRALWGTLHPW